MAENTEPLNLKPLGQLPIWVKRTKSWVELIEIKKIQYKNSYLSLHYRVNQIGELILHHNAINYHGRFKLNAARLNVRFESDSLADDSNITGELSVFIPDQSIKGRLFIQLPKTPKIDAKLYGNVDYYQFAVSAEAPLSTLDPLVDYLGINPQTRPWITTYLQGKEFVIDKFIGNIRYDASQHWQQQMYAKAHVLEASYTFDPALSPIKAKSVDVIFHRGKLFIIPKEGSFYDLPTQNSQLYIDFMTHHTMLYAHILTDGGKLNTQILAMLKHYDILVPIQQLKGTCNVDLRLGIDLDTYKTTAKGTFRPSPSEILLDEYTFTAKDALVTLDTTKVTFQVPDVRYKNLMQASVQGEYNAKNESGKITITPSSLMPTGNRSDLALKTGAIAPKINYVISPKGDRIEISPSEWSFYGDTLKIGSLNAPYDYAHSSLNLAKLPFTLNSQLQGSLNGTLSSNQINLLLQMDQINYKGIKLRQSPLLLRLLKDSNGTRLSIDQTSLWEFGGEKVSISPITANILKTNLIFSNIRFNAERQFSGMLSGRYNIQNNSGELTFNKLMAQNPKLTPSLSMIDQEKILFRGTDSAFIVHSDDLGMDLETISDGWKMKINDLSMIAKKSPVLRQYEITNGNLNLYYYPKLERYTFDGEISYPYKIMMVGDESFSKYRFSGSSQDKKSTIRINDRLMIHYADTIDIRANNMGINLPELYRWISNQDHNTTDTHDSTANSEQKIRLNLTNGYLYLMKNRKIMLDSLFAEMSDGIIEGRMMHHQGSADFTMGHGLFYIEGNHFNDRFMNNLFRFSDFHGGELSFKAQGSSKATSGVVKIDNTILKEYRLLNNILSFVNTVPSLATFSLPNYNTKGLPVKEAYAHFTYQNNWINVDNFVLNSPEIKLIGNTRGNVDTDTIDGEITLKTDLGSSLGKVPMVGYILFGNDGSLSTTLKISGKLSDPSIDTSIAKEVGIAPFNILKRTITYPFLWMMKDEKK